MGATARTPRVALVGTAPPRRCGIATFTDDVRQALAALDPRTPPVQVALTDPGSSYDYGQEVVFEIREGEVGDYRAAAEYVNGTGVELVCVQHEFGIFGGPAGQHVDELLDQLRTPIVTTLHTVLADPPADLLAATRRLAARSDRLVVLAEQALELLETGYGIGGEHVRVIPHGVPSFPSIEPPEAKRTLGAGGRTVLLTFGLLGPAKGIELVIEALPEIVAAHPSVLYLVLGATHPHVVRDHGEAYRESLLQRVEELGLTEHVSFVDRYVDLDELRLHLAATDVYLTPYHDAEQIVSGTLAYAVGMGLTVVSTPYRYATELLADGCGELVPFGDAGAIAETVSGLLANDARRAAMQRRAAARGTQMSWPAVAGAYEDLFREVIAEHERKPVAWRPASIPQPDLSALHAMTDDTGLFQHAHHDVPLRAHGYCTDDVSRGLVVAVQAHARRGDPVAVSLVPTYLSFLAAAQRPDGRFENLLAYDRHFVPDSDSEDTLGQAIWGLGATISETPDDGWRALAIELFDRALPRAAELRDTKSVAYAIVGLSGHLQHLPGALATRRAMRQLAVSLSDRLEARRRIGGQWFDEALTYGNAKVPEALMLAGRDLDEARWVEQGLASLDFLLDATWAASIWMDGAFDFVGNESWKSPPGSAVYGQQPIEAGYTAQACMIAFEVTGEARYERFARAAVEWLLGRNRLGLALYDPATGRCADGLDRHGPSSNSGAESLVCSLMALLAYPAGPVAWAAPANLSTSPSTTTPTSA